MTKVVFKSTSTLINQVTKFQDGMWKIFAKQIFTTFAEPDWGFIHILTPEQGCITSQKLGHKKNAIFIYKQAKRQKKKFYLH